MEKGNTIQIHKIFDKEKSINYFHIIDGGKEIAKIKDEVKLGDQDCDGSSYSSLLDLEDIFKDLRIDC